MKQGKDRPHPPRPTSRPTKSPGGAYWLAGTHAVAAALANPDRRLRRLVATAEAARSLPDPARAEILDKTALARLLPPGAVHQGVAVLVDPLEPPSLADIIREAHLGESAVVVVLDQVTDPHNVGAILRSAAAFGALAVIAPDRHAPEETAALAKAASGALERMPLVRVTNVARTLDELKEGGFWTAGLAADAPQTLAEARLDGRVALVLGAEGEGLRRLTREHCDRLVRLPMSGAVESLNVSNAAAVALYELARN